MLAPINLSLPFNIEVNTLSRRNLMALRYEIDQYVDEEHSEDEVNVSCVCRWKIIDNRSSLEVDIDFLNSWVFNSCQPRLRPGQTDLVIAELRRGWG